MRDGPDLPWSSSAVPVMKQGHSPISPAMRIEDMIDRATTSCIYSLSLKIFDV
jgi:hypothetical protein